jgi:hypothetical protein
MDKNGLALRVEPFFFSQKSPDMSINKNIITKYHIANHLPLMPRRAVPFFSRERKRVYLRKRQKYFCAIEQLSGRRQNRSAQVQCSFYSISLKMAL